MRTTATLLTVLLLAACSSGSDDASDTTGDTTTEDVDEPAATDAGPEDDAEEPSAEDANPDDPDTTDEAADEPADDTTATTEGDADDPATSTTTAVESNPTTTAADTGDDPDDSPAPTTTSGAEPTAPPPTTTAAPPTTTTPPPPPGLDAAAARQAFDAAVGSFTAADGFVDLPECPLDPTGALLPATFAGNGEAAVVAAVDSPPENGIFDIGGGFGPMLTCDRFSEDDADSVGLFAFRPPAAGLNAYAEWFANPDEDEGITISVEQTGTLEGGTINRVCGLDEFSDDFDFCEIDWVSDEIVIGVYVSGPVANTADLATLENGFTDQLEAVVAAFTS